MQVIVSVSSFKSSQEFRKALFSISKCSFKNSDNMEKRGTLPLCRSSRSTAHYPLIVSDESANWNAALALVNTVQVEFY